MLVADQSKSLAFNQRALTANSMPALDDRDTGELHFLYPRGMHGLGDWLSDIEATVENAASGTIDNSVNTAIQQGQAAVVSAQTAADPVPFQNALYQSVLAPVSAALQIPAVQTSVASLQALAAFLNNGLMSMRTWVQAHPSSRANGMVSTLMPYFNGLSANITSRLAQLGSSVNVIPGTNIALNTGMFSNLTSSPVTMLALAAGVWYFFLRK